MLPADAGARLLILFIVLCAAINFGYDAWQNMRRP